MATLRELVEGRYAANTAEEILAALTAAVEYPSSVFWTYTGFIGALQEAGVDQSILLDVPGWVRSLAGGSTMDVMLSCAMGCPIGSPQIQTVVADQLAVATDPHTIKGLQVIQAIGAPVSVPVWQSESLSEEPTLEVISPLVVERELLRIYSAVLVQVRAGSLDLAGAKALFAAE